MSEQLILKKLREKIDKIDSKILELIGSRSDLAKKIVNAKNGQDIFKPEREEALINRLISISGDSNPQFVENIWRTLISENLFLQGGLKISVGSSKDAYETAKWHFGRAAQIDLLKSNEEAFNKLVSDNYDAAVVPLDKNLKETYIIDDRIIRKNASSPVATRNNLLKIAIYKKDV